MRRAFAVLLPLLLVPAFAGCGDDTPDGPSVPPPAPAGAPTAVEPPATPEPGILTAPDTVPVPEGQGHPTPAACFEALRQAGEERDFVALYELTDPRARQQLLTMGLMVLSMKSMAASPEAKQEARNEMMALLDRHGIDPSFLEEGKHLPADPAKLRALLDGGEDLSGLFAELMERAGGADRVKALQFTGIEEITVAGDKAWGKATMEGEGQVQKEKIDFVRRSGVWFLALPK